MQFRIIINGIQIDQRRRIAVTVAAARGLNLDQRGMIDIVGMHNVEGIGMAGGAITACGKRFIRGQADQSAFGIMTAATVVMNLGVGRVDQRWLIAVAVAAACTGHCHQCGMVDRVRMNGIERIGMTGGAVPARGKGLACGQADRIVVSIVAVETAAVRLRVDCVGQRRRVAVAVAAAGGADRHQAVVVIEEGVDGTEVGVALKTVDRGAVDAVSNSLRDNRRTEFAAAVAVTEGTVGAMQGINVGLGLQGAGARLTDNARIAGMAVGTNRRNHPIVMGRLMICGLVFVAGVAGDGSEAVPGREDLGHDDIIAEIMDITDLVMAGVADDGLTGGHIVADAGGSYRLSVVSRHDVRHICIVTGRAGRIRGRNRVMNKVPLSPIDPMAPAAVVYIGVASNRKEIFGKNQIRPAAVLVNTVVGDLHSAGVDVGIAVITVISGDAA